MKIKLDENLGTTAQGLLADADLDVHSVPQEGLCSSSDRAILAACAREGRCLITLDLDFSNPIEFPPGEHAGVVVIRLSGKDSDRETREALGVFLREVRNSLPAGRLWVIQGNRLREYESE